MSHINGMTLLLLLAAPATAMFLVATFNYFRGRP